MSFEYLGTSKIREVAPNADMAGSTVRNSAAVCVHMFFCLGTWRKVDVSVIRSGGGSRQCDFETALSREHKLYHIGSREGMRLRVVYLILT